MNNKFPSSKIYNPYLYPFKMKPPRLYSSKTIFTAENPKYDQVKLLQLSTINEIATEILLQSPITQVLNTTEHLENETSKERSFQTNLVVPNPTFSEKSTVLKMTMTAILEKPNIATTNLERLKPKNIHHNRPKPCTKELKSTDVAVEIPMVLNLWSPEHNLANMPDERLYTAFQRPVTVLEKENLMYSWPDTLETPIPKDINWTRMDIVQKKIDMIPTRTKVVMGVVCGMIATAAVHPLDVVKVRLQLFPKNMTTLCMLQRIVACEGPCGLYAGLTAGMLRQLTYTGARLTVYHSLYANYKANHGKNPDFHERMRIAVVAGLVGAFMGVPSEVVLVRMIEVRRLRRSRNGPARSTACRPMGALRKLLRIARREGVATWWRGVVPTLVRSIFVTSTQVGIYKEIREAFAIADYEFTGPYIHFYCAGISSIFSAILSLPVDQVKTRYQSYQERHRHAKDILKDILRKNGVRYLWKGFLPYYLRQAAHTMITYVVLDHLIDAYVDFQETKN